eukprot:10557342-Lingulodinium_polyedra.AAC.1
MPSRVAPRPAPSPMPPFMFARPAVARFGLWPGPSAPSSSVLEALLEIAKQSPMEALSRLPSAPLA